MTATMELSWHRIPSQHGDFCDGYRDDSGRFQILRHHVDDRDFDGGRVGTYWNLIVDGDPVQQHNSLGDAKRDAQRIAASNTTVAELYALSSAVRTQQRRARNLERQRADAIRHALADGWTHARIAEATGLTRGRINQLAHPTGGTS